MSETSETNGPVTERILTLDAARKPHKKGSDLLTRDACAAIIRDTLAAEIPKIHEYYLEQIPTFVARMVQDALLHYGLIKPIEPVDIATATIAETEPETTAETTATEPLEPVA